MNTVGNRVILCGGWTTRTSCIELLQNETWSHHSTTLLWRAEHSSAVVGGKLLLAGGGFVGVSSAELLEPPNTWTALPSPGLDKDYSSDACIVPVNNTSFITVGGGDEYSRDVTLHHLDGTQEELAPLRVGRAGHGCTVVNTETSTLIVVAGGWTSDTWASTSTEVYSVQDNRWEDGGHLNTGRCGHRMITVENKKILAMGGWDNTRNRTKSVEEYDIESGTWSYTREMKVARVYHAITAVEGVCN